MSSSQQPPSRGVAGGGPRRDWYVLEERHAMLTLGRVATATAIAAAAWLPAIEATSRERMGATAACALALALYLLLYLLPRRRPRRLLVAVDAALVVDAGLILALARLSGGVESPALWLLPPLALAVTLGHSAGFGVKALILGGIVMGALYAVAEPGAPAVADTGGPLLLAAVVVLVAAALNGVNERDLQRRLERLDTKWATSASLTSATEAGQVLEAARRAFATLLRGWDVAVGPGGGLDAERTRREHGRVVLEVPLAAPGTEVPRPRGRLTATRALPRWGRPRIRGHVMGAVREVAADAGAALTRIESVERLERLSLSDPLTGLGNRRAFDVALGAEIERSRRETTPLGLVMVDVDHFKRFNDRHGHQAGDEVLVAVAVALSAEARAGDHVCRVGGEEFALLLPGADEAAAASVAERVRIAVEASPTPYGATTVSLGVAAAPRGQGGGTALVRAADARLYAAKEAGRNRVVAGTL